MEFDIRFSFKFRSSLLRKTSSDGEEREIMYGSVRYRITKKIRDELISIVL